MPDSLQVVITDDRGRQRLYPIHTFTSASSLANLRAVKEVNGTLTAGLANAFAFTWQNPETTSILVLLLDVRVTTAGGSAGSVLDAGSAANATTTSDNLLDGQDLNAVAAYNNVNNGGTNGRALQIVDPNGGTTDWITGQILTANASNLVGTYRIVYITL